MKKFMFLLGVLVSISLLLTAGWLVISTVNSRRSVTETTQQTTAEVTTEAATEAPTETTVVETTEAPTEATTLPTEVTYDFELASHHAFVYDLTNDRLRYQLGGLYDRVYPASLTKLFTALVVLEHMDPEDTVTVGGEVYLIDPDSTRAYVYEGQTLTVGDCVQGMLMQSGNDAAYVLAVGCGRVLAGNPDMGYEDALAVFIEEMNRSARMAGLYDTQFRTPDGIHDEGHYTTMADLISFCSLALQNERIRTACATAVTNVTYVSGQHATWYNTNSLLREDSEFYNPRAIGLKTGTTDAAGACLLSAFDCDGTILLIGVLGAQEKPARYTDTVALFDEFSGYEPVHAAASEG